MTSRFGNFIGILIFGRHRGPDPGPGLALGPGLARLARPTGGPPRGPVRVWPGIQSKSWPGVGLAGPGPAWPGLALAKPDLAQAWPGPAWSGLAWPRPIWPGSPC